MNNWRICGTVSFWLLRFALLSAVSPAVLFAQPVITNQPQSQSVLAGENATFGALADGSPPLVYQWRFNGTPLPDATNASLALVNVQLFQSGDYQLLVTNSAGSATSDVATLTVSFRPNFLWARQAGGTNDADSTRCISTDAAGNIYVAGEFYGSAMFGTNQLVDTTGYAYGEMFLAKYTKAGELVWLKQVSGNSTVAPLSLKLDSSNNIYVCGGFNQSAQFGSTTLSNSSTYSGGGFLAKFDGNGNALWAIQPGGGGAECAVNLALDSGGNPVITGYFQGTVTFGNQTFSGSGSQEIYVAKYTASGVKVWVHFGSSSGSDIGGAVTVDNAGNTYAAGYSVGSPGVSLSFYNGFVLNRPAGWVVMPYLTKIDPNGIMQWVVTSASVLYPKDAVAAGTNEVYLVGGKLSVSRVDAAGNELWARAPAVTNAWGEKIARDGSGNIYLAGTYLDPVISFPGLTLTNSVNENQEVVVSYDSLGNFRWAKQIAGLTNLLYGLAVSQARELYVGGKFFSSGNIGADVLTSYGGSDAFFARLGVLPPVITVLPEGRTVFTGMGTTFSVQAEGEAPLQYQWRFNDNDLPAATNSSLTLTDIQLTSAGSYSVLVSNDFGVAVSPAAVLNVVTGAPAILIQPLSQVATSGTTRVLFVLATNSLPLAYQWRLNDTNLAGATAASLVRSNLSAADRGDYRVEITNAFGSVLSDVAMLTVRVRATIISQPTNQVVPSGTDVTFAVIAIGDDVVTCQWRLNNSAIAGATNSLLTITNAQLTNQGNYSVVVSNLYGAATSASASLVVNAPPSFTAQPQSSTLSAGTNVTLSATVSGSPTLRYQWLLNDVPLAGKTLSSLSLSNIQSANSGSYTIAATNAFGAITSSPAILSVTPSAPVILAHPLSISAAVGTTNVKFSVQAAGSSPLFYRWLFNGGLLADATNTTLTISNVQFAAAGTYHAMVSNDFGVTLSRPALLRIEQAPDVLWAIKQGSAADEQGLAVAVDAATNIYVAGTFANSLSLGSSNFLSSGGTDIFFAKYNSLGGLLWAQKCGGASADAAQSLRVDKSGNVFIAGNFFSSTASFGGIIVTNNSSPVAAFSDAFLAKFGSDGNVLWVRTASGSRNDQATAVAVDEAGNAYLTGSYHNAAMFGGIGLTNLANTNFFVAKYDPAGDVVWAKTATGTNYCQGNGVAVDSSANVIVTGFIYGTANFGSGSITNTNSVSSFSGNATVFVAKYDGNGALQWARKGGTNGMGFGQNVAADSSGNIFATSYRRSYGGGVMLTKYDGGGSVLWVRTNNVGCCTDNFISVSGIALDAAGNPLLAGGGSAYTTLEGLTLNAQGFIVKYRSSDGAPYWILKSGNIGNAVGLDGDGNAYVAGSFYNTALFGMSSNLTSSGGNDAFLVKFGISAPTITGSPADQFVIAGSNSTLQVTTAGMPATYQWLLNGTNIPGATGAICALNGFNWLQSGRYSVIVQSGSGWTTSSVAGISLIPVVSVARAAEAVVLDWDGTFTLQSAPGVLGPYSDVISGDGPVTNPVAPGDVERYFRLRQPSSSLSGAMEVDAFALTFTGSPGRRYGIESSTNLMEWTPLMTDVFPFALRDTNVSFQKFYRVRLLP